MTGWRLAAMAAAVTCGPLAYTPACAADMIRSQFDMRDATGRLWRIYTAQPVGDKPADGWPVVWLLDANMTFAPAVEQKPQALLVGIGYPLRQREDIVAQRYMDLTTPATADNIPLRPGQAVPQTGGAALYRRFILEQVQPTIAAHFPVDTSRQTLYGHSLGGLFVLDMLVHSRQSFQTYCAADPSIWWNGHEILPRLSEVSHAVGRAPVRVRISISGRKACPEGLTDAAKARIRHLRSGANGQTVYNMLRQAKAIKADFKAYRHETHGSLLAVSVRDCLSHAAAGSHAKQQHTNHKQKDEVRNAKAS